MPYENTSKSQSEIVTSSTDNNPKIKELEKQLSQKDMQIENIREKANIEIDRLKNLKKNSDDVAPGIRKTYEFTASFKNGYSDGTVKKGKEKLIKEEFVKRHG